MLDASHLSKANCKLGFARIETGTKGAMVVSFRQGSKGLHYIQSVDFHVN
jgi:hypothetical protein